MTLHWINGEAIVKADDGLDRFYPVTAEPTLWEHEERYEDTGCELHPACLSCPLPACRYDQPTQQDKTRQEQQRRAVAAAWRQGMTQDQIAKALGISRRTVLRRLRAGRSS